MLRFAFPAFSLALVLAAPAQAAPECKDLKDFIQTETAGAQKFVDIFTFHKHGRGDNVLLLFKDTKDKGQPPKRWLFLNRPSPDMSGFCALGRGEGFGQHDDKPQLLYAGEFGLPGSNKPRCTTSDRYPAPDVLRAYANRTLGDGEMVLYTTGDDASGFQFAIDNKQNWIIIRDNSDESKTSCLYDQGNDVFMKFNNSVPAP